VAGKDRIVAGLLALFLGGFGVHKFYLGLNGPGIIILMTNTVGLTVTAFFAFIPNYILLLVAFIEGIIYLTRSQKDFEARYVHGRRAWF
jgi:TM2 domain-containing membrane protein YozV